MYEERVVEVRKNISIAQAELERIKENRKITKKGKRNRAVLEKECKGLSGCAGPSRICQEAGALEL